MLFKTFELFEYQDLNELMPEIIYYYLFDGLSLIDIEYKLFKTYDYRGWLSKALLNYYGIDTKKGNKGIYADRSVAGVVEELSQSQNSAHMRVANLLKARR